MKLLTAFPYRKSFREAEGKKGVFVGISGE